MTFTIHDVGHGFCASLVDNGGIASLFDCGDTGPPKAWDPGQYLKGLGVTEVSRLYMSNFDQDHVSGLPAVLVHFPPRSIWRNPSVSAEWLQQEKLRLGPLTAAMSAWIKLHWTYTDVHVPALPDGVATREYWNTPNDFQDTNNLSMVELTRLCGAPHSRVNSTTLEPTSAGAQASGNPVVAIATPLANTIVAVAANGDVYARAGYSAPNGYFGYQGNVFAGGPTPAAQPTFDQLKAQYRR